MCTNENILHTLAGLCMGVSSQPLYYLQQKLAICSIVGPADQVHSLQQVNVQRYNVTTSAYNHSKAREAGIL